MTNKPMLSVELLPCPYCGSSANLEDLRLVWCVRCTKCSACVLGDRAPEPHGDGISSNEIQDAQARKMAENTDWASYEKSAVDAWNSRSTPATQHQGHADEQALCLVPAELVALLRADLRQEVESARLSLSNQFQGEPVAWVIGTEDGNGADYYPGKGLDTLEIGAKLYAEQPAPVYDHPQCEECKGWGYHENHYDGGGTECGECSGSGKAPVEQFSGDTVVCRRYQLEQHPGQNFYHYDLEPVYGSVPVTLSELITMVESAPVAVVMPDFESACGHLVETAKDSNGEYINSYAVLGAQIWEAARLNGAKP